MATYCYQHPDSARTPVFDPQKSRLMVKMMEGVIAHGTGKKAALDRPAAGKTGTSQNWRDAWFVGFTPDWIAGVWVGDDRSRPMAKVAGGELPSEMWRRFMVAAHQGVKVSDFPAPEATPPSPMEAQAAPPPTSMRRTSLTPRRPAPVIARGRLTRTATTSRWSPGEPSIRASPTTSDRRRAMERRGGTARTANRSPSRHPSDGAASPPRRFPRSREEVAWTIWT